MYQVKPIVDVIPAGQTKTCTIVLKKLADYPDATNPKAVRHKFLVQSCNFDAAADSSALTTDSIQHFWKSIEQNHKPAENKHAYHEQRIPCKLSVPAKARAEAASAKGEAQAAAIAASSSGAPPAAASQSQSSSFLGAGAAGGAEQPYASSQVHPSAAPAAAGAAASPAPASATSSSTSSSAAPVSASSSTSQAHLRTSSTGSGAAVPTSPNAGAGARGSVSLGMKERENRKRKSGVRESLSILFPSLVIIFVVFPLRMHARVHARNARTHARAGGRAGGRSCHLTSFVYMYVSACVRAVYFASTASPGGAGAGAGAGAGTSVTSKELQVLRQKAKDFDELVKYTVEKEAQNKQLQARDTYRTAEHSTAQRGQSRMHADICVGA